MKKALLAPVVAALLLIAAQVQAIPSLQLDIAGGSYNPASGTGYDPLHNVETIVGPSVPAGTPITLYAYLNPDGDKSSPNSTATLTDTYYLSIAVYPKQEQTTPEPSLGSIKINGVELDVTGAMVYGAPPIEASQSWDGGGGDLQKHSVYETYFLQLKFSFNDPPQLTKAYNTQDYPGKGLDFDLTGDMMYYEIFSVDTTNLTPGYFIHFDLYNSFTETATEKICTGQGPDKVCVDITTDTANICINSFAPFSHDAESDGHTTVPEPSTLILLGAGILGLGVARRKKIAA